MSEKQPLPELGISPRPTKARERQLVSLIEQLLDALDKQCFPVASGEAARCRYSMNVEDAMRKARAALPKKPPPPEIDPRDVPRPKGTRS